LAATFTPNGRTLVTATSNGQLEVTDVASGTTSYATSCSCGNVTGLFVRQDGAEVLAVGSKAAMWLTVPDLAPSSRAPINLAGIASEWPSTDANLKTLLLEGNPYNTLVSLQGGAPRRIDGGRDLVFMKTHRMAFLAADGSRVIWLQDGAAHWQDPGDRTAVARSLVLGGQPFLAAADSRAHTVAVALTDGRIRVVDLDTGHDYSINGFGVPLSIAFAGKNDGILLLQRPDGAFFLIDGPNGERRREVTFPARTPMPLEALVGAGPDQLLGLGGGQAVVLDATTLLLKKTIAVERSDAGKNLVIGPTVALAATLDGAHGFIFREGRAAELLDLTGLSPSSPDGQQAIITSACTRMTRKMTPDERSEFRLINPPASRYANLLEALPALVSRQFLPPPVPHECGGVH
jgi:hypothetical protein